MALIEGLGFPEPPHRLVGALSGVRLAAGMVAVSILLLAGVGILVAYFGFTASGRALLVDTALAAGLGSAVPGARVTLGECEYSGSRAGSKVPGQWRCNVVVEHAGERVEAPFETVSRQEDVQPPGAGRVFGRLGLYWPLGMMAARWWNATFLLIIGFGLIGICTAMRGFAADALRASRLRDGRVRSVDLLTWQGRPTFSFVDDEGQRRFGRAERAGLPLILDGVCTTGAALVQGRSALLLDAGLHPLELASAQRAAILERATQVRRQALVRSALPAQPGDAPTLPGRIERIEQAFAALPRGAGDARSETLARLHDDAWRLVWDSDDPDVATRALALRDRIAERLGPEGAWAALQQSRTRHAATGA